VPPLARAVVASWVVGLLWAFALGSPPSSLADEPSPYIAPEAIFTEPSPGEPLPACPDAPEAPVPPTPEEEAEEGFEAPDAAAVETRLARIEAVETCRAIVRREDLQVSRLWWVVAQQVKAEPVLSDLLSRLVEVRDRPNCGDPCEVSIAPLVESLPVIWSEALPVHDAGAGAATEEYSGELVSSIDAGAESSSAALWFIAAVLVGLPLCGLIYVTVRRGL
jgi:hypothetical protein